MLRKLAMVAALCCIAAVVLLRFLPAAHQGDLVDHDGDCLRGAAPPTWQHLNQGWSPLEEWEFWYTSQGSQMISYDWFLALDQPEHPIPFAAPEYLAELGFVAAPRGRCNPDALPLGFALDVSTGQLGLSCAACHTRLIRTAGREILVNGAPAEIHFNRFVTRLAEALEHTLDDPKIWARFTQRLHSRTVAPQDSAALRTDVAQAAQRLRQFQHFVSAGGNDDGEFAGYGRVDAFGAIFNRVAVAALDLPGNYQPADAPVNYPFLWGAAQLDITQWNGSAPNRVPFGPLARNLGEAIGLFGGVTLTSEGESGFHSPVKIINLHKLEELTQKLRPPSWNEARLPPLDPALVAQGYKIYTSECRKCHILPFDKYPVAPPHPIYSRDCLLCHAEARIVSLDTVGTDPLAARNYMDREADTGSLNGRRRWLLFGEPYAARAPTHDLVITAIVGVILDDRLGSFTAPDLPALLNGRPSADVAGYKARPLSGIWATAPYLHNGSVPTLADLLEAPEQRPVDFRMGPLEFDTKRIGLSSNSSRLPTTYFDTRLPGNSNAGHRFGTELGAGDKRALLEFLKTL
jgi:hypothetical protein